MTDQTIQTANFKLQKIGRGDISATASQTASTGSAAGSSQELEPGDYNAILALIDSCLQPNGGLTSPGGTVAATGTVQADAAPILSRVIVVTGADAAKGVLLPAAKAGATVFLKNNAAAVLKVWPSGTNTINAIAASTSISMASLTGAVFICGVDGAWFTIPLLPS